MLPAAPAPPPSGVARRGRWALVGLAVALAAAGARLSADAVTPARGIGSAFAPVTIWAVGDGADGGANARALARRIAAERPALLLYLGDVYEQGSAADFRERYDTVYGALADRTAPTPGNHDWPSHAVGYDVYWRARTGRPTPAWYGTRIGGWRLLSLNSEAPQGPGSAQLRWLTRQLDPATGTCTLAFWHRPYRSAGSHGDQPDIAPLWNALRGRARLVLNGHDHNMQRLRVSDGITQFVSGAGGRSHYSLRADPRLAFGDDTHDGALRVELRPGRATLEFVAADGTVLDRSSVRCATGQAEGPTPP